MLFMSTTSCSDIIHDNTLKEIKLIKLSTNMGDITIELFQDKAPETVANFLKYTKHKIKMKNNDRYRVEIIQKNNHRAWSSPIWIKN